MVFSFFKKKDKQPEEKMPERPAARPKPPGTPLGVQATSAAEQTPAANPLAELPDLEFSAANLAAPAAASVPLPVEPKPAPSFLSTETAPIKKVPPAKPSAPEYKPEPEKDFSISEFDRNFTESSVMAIDVEQDADPLQAEIEQVAVLFANGQDAAVRSLLDVFVRSYQGEEAMRFWAMYFDFLQLAGDKTAFDALGLEFAARCETSPPTWSEKCLAEANIKTQEAVFDQQADRQLADSLRARLIAGQRTDQASWHQCFEVLQRLGEQAEFEEVALDFAVTFEQSPPSWEPLAPVLIAPVDLAEPDDAYYFSGDIRSCKFEELKAFLEQHAVPVLDFSAVRRMDFFSAGQLVNRLGLFKHDGGDVIIRHPNHLLSELLGVVGINKYARILKPKF